MESKRLSLTAKSGIRKLIALVEPNGQPWLCNAPSSSIYLDQRGDVRACCQNAGFPLGNITQASLRSIWDGERARRLRASVDAGDLSLGCNFCRWQIDEDNQDAVFARTFDHLKHGGAEPEWPQQLELSLSNACNLQCVMCNGEWSSSIRTHREKLPPLPAVYGEQFFADLAEFLPHLKVVKFLGGEPFLGSESLRVMEMLAELGTDIPVHITTNGTQWSRRIERILDRLNVYLVVSLDGVSTATYESIRVGASLETVVGNIDHFVDYSKSRGTSLSLSHCLMTANWREFKDFLLFAEERDCTVWVNTVTEPYDMSLYHLHPDGLKAVLSELNASDRAVSAQLTGRRREVWMEQLERLAHHLASIEEYRPPDYIAKRRELGFAWIAHPRRASRAEQDLRGKISDESGYLVSLKADGSVQRIDLMGDQSYTLAELVGVEVKLGEDFPAVLADPDHRNGDDLAEEDTHHYRLTRETTGGVTVETEVTRVARRDDDGVIDGVLIWISELGGRTGTRIDDEESSIPHLSAHSWALAYAGSPEDLGGFRLDRSGCITGFIGDRVGMFGVELSGLIGRPATELIPKLADRLGSLDGPVQNFVDRTGPVSRYMNSVRGADGSGCQLYSFAEPDGYGSTMVWVARVTNAK